MSRWASTWPLSTITASRTADSRILLNTIWTRSVLLPRAAASGGLRSALSAARSADWSRPQSLRGSVSAAPEPDLDDRHDSMIAMKWCTSPTLSWVMNCVVSTGVSGRQNCRVT